jgi:hypothetical protein
MLKKPKLKIAALAAILLGASLPATGFAGVETTDGKSDGKTPVEETTKSYISGDIGVTVTNAYYSRGILQERDGVIVQPNADLFFKLYEGNGFINNVTLSLSLWDSLHSKQTAHSPGSTVSSWYESDYYVGLAVGFAKNFTLTTSYFEFDYPSGAANPQRSVNFNLAYDDSGFLNAFALHPHVTYLYNFDGIAGIGKTDASYFEVGIAPSYTVAPKSSYPLTLTLPVTAGFGDSHFYPTDRFGYLSAGLTLSFPLAFIPKGYGTWTMTFSGLYYILGDDTNNVNRGDRSTGVGSGTLTLAF